MINYLKITVCVIYRFGLLLLLLSCSSTESKHLRFFDVPEGIASTTLRLFAEQAQVEIIFDNASIDEVTTCSVKGEMTALEALQVMIGDSELSFYCDQDSQSYAISFDHLNRVSETNRTEYER